MSGMFTELKKLDDKKVRRNESNLPSMPIKQSLNDIPLPNNVHVGTKRIFRTRQAFDVYEDQYQSLKNLAEKERAKGLPGSMSKMVRDALDVYIKEHS